MNMMTRQRGTFVISWSQTEIDGLSGAPVTSLGAGAMWAWTGEPVQIDSTVGGMATQSMAEQDEFHRRRAAASARRIVARALVQEGVRTPFVDDVIEFDRSFTVSDGNRSWTATLIEMPEIARPLLMFHGSMPRSHTPYFVSEGVVDPALPSRHAEGAEGVVCFTPGTKLETPSGSRLVEDIVAGDMVVTKDGGAQSVLWSGCRNVSGARLYAMPDLRPVRIREGALGSDRPLGDLIVSPDHRMLIQGQAAEALWGQSEVLVAARYLINGNGVVRDMGAKSVTYHHLMLASHHVLIANGVETESFHPGAARLDAIEEAQRQRLYDVLPDLAYDPKCYGPMTRRALTQAEAALLPTAA